MDYVRPRGNLGTSLVRAGTRGRAAPTPVPHGFGYVVAVALTEMCAESDLEACSPGPDTTGWRACTLKCDSYFPIDQRARGHRQEQAANGQVRVDFEFVAAIVPEDRVAF